MPPDYASGFLFSAAEPADQAALDAAVGALVADQDGNQAAMEKALRATLRSIGKAESLNDILGLIDDQIAEIETKPLQDKLARALFVAAVWGRLHAVE